jgi:endonuclease/exonuclease/phosphatase family metal-dependent hydrolase
VSSNIGFGAYNQDFDFFMDGGTQSIAASKHTIYNDINGISREIEAKNPDFLFFQEVDTDGTRSYHINEYSLIRENFPSLNGVFCQNYNSPYLLWPLYRPHGANQSGLVTLSRYEITDATRYQLPVSGGLSKFLDLDRCYSVTRISAGKHDLVLFNVHLSAYGANDTIMSNQRIALYREMIAERKAGNYVIVGGDFNHDMIGVSDEIYHNATDSEASWAQPYDFGGLPDGFTIACKEKLDEEGSGNFSDAATCRDAGKAYDGTNDRWIMDTFIYSDNIECVSYETMDLDFEYSDHNPVIMSFKLKDASTAS